MNYGYNGAFMDNICWVQGLYTKKLVNEAQGTSGKIDHMCDPTREECWHHYYYQWVTIFIVVQAGFFYTPRLVLYCTAEKNFN